MDGIQYHAVLIKYGNTEQNGDVPSTHLQKGRLLCILYNDPGRKQH